MIFSFIITPSSSKLVTTTFVVSSHEISDHDQTCTNVNTKRYKSPQRTYHYRNIKSINLELFEQAILSSSLFSSPDPTVDGYANQMETELTSILDKVAPLKTGHRTGPRKAKNWLSPEAVDAKKRRCRLERRWKASNAKSDRLAYRAIDYYTSFAASNIDSGKITILTALDMSAAFDTLDHITLLHRLQHTFGVSGYVISWIRSYLTDRSSFVKIDSSSSPSTTILTGVPQGSVLGPLLFVLFISPIANVINSDQSNQNSIVSFHQYADDTQLYIGTHSSTLTFQIASIESQRVHDWLWIMVSI